MIAIVFVKLIIIVIMFSYVSGLLSFQSLNSPTRH